jgi:hypothetical protein
MTRDDDGLQWLAASGPPKRSRPSVRSPSDLDVHCLRNNRTARTTHFGMSVSSGAVRALRGTSNSIISGAYGGFSTVWGAQDMPLSAVTPPVLTLNCANSATAGARG